MLEITDSLEEAIRIYEREDKRKSALETKASTLLGFVSFLLVFLNFFVGYFFPNTKTFPEMNVVIIILIISIVLITISIVLLLNTLRLRTYVDPLNLEKREELDLSLRDRKLKDNLLVLYINSIVLAYKNNSKKSFSLDLAEKFLAAGIVLPLITFAIVLIFRIN